MSAILGGTCRNPLFYLFNIYMQIYCSINIQSLDIGHLPAESIESNNLTIAYVTQTLCSLFHNKGK